MATHSRRAIAASDGALSRADSTPYGSSSDSESNIFCSDEEVRIDITAQGPDPEVIEEINNEVLDHWFDTFMGISESWSLLLPNGEVIVTEMSEMRRCGKLRQMFRDMIIEVVLESKGLI